MMFLVPLTLSSVFLSCPFMLFNIMATCWALLTLKISPVCYPAPSTCLPFQTLDVCQPAETEGDRNPPHMHSLPDLMVGFQINYIPFPMISQFSLSSSLEQVKVACFIFVFL